MRNNLRLIILLFTPFFVFSQFTEEQLQDFVNTASMSELVQKNMVFMLESNYYQASVIADKLLESEPDNANFNYRKGYALINSTVDFTKSKPYLIKAATKISKNYDMFSAKEDGSPVDAIYHLGRAYHLNNEIDKAIEHYEEFLERAPRKSDNIAPAKLKIKQCYVAKELLPIDKGFKVRNLGPVINTDDPEYAPVVSLDGAALYFTSRRLRVDSSNIDIKEPGTNMHLEDVYVSYKDFDDEWGEAVIMDFSLPEQNEATVYVSPDERRIYVYRDYGGVGNLYFSDFQGSRFREIQEVEIEGVNTEYWEPHITVTPDGRRKFFTSDRPGGYGGRDIYFIEKKEDGTWTEPKNMGPTINSEHDEDAPFMSVDNRTFYFSSNGEKSMGGFDVFISRMDEDGNWSEPENLGSPLNTTGDDIYYTTTIDGFTGYISSFRVDGQGEKDIYEVTNEHLGIEKTAALKGEIETVGDAEIPEDIAYTLRCINCEDSYPLTLFPRLSDRTFFAPLEACKTYELTFHYDDGKEEIHKETFSTNCVDDYHEIYRHILLDAEEKEIVEPKEEVKSFEPLAMKHFFGYNKNKLNPEKGALKEFLMAINDQLEDGRTSIDININSSASRVRTKTFGDNQTLAQSRADKVKELLEDYFKDKGIDSVSLTINEVKVDGPEYTNRDYKNIEKYAPYQFVELNVAGENNIEDELMVMKSKDAELDQGTDLPGTVVESMTDKDGDTFTKGGSMIESDYIYSIVVGVFKRISYAEGLVEELKTKGFNDGTIVGKRNGLHVVSAGSANTISEARSLLEKARSEVTTSAWILNNKK